MIRAFIEQCPVVRNKDIALFTAQIFTDLFSCVTVKMIGRLIYQQEFVLTRKQHSKQSLCSFSRAERFKRAVEYFRTFVKFFKFAYHSPYLTARFYLVKELSSRLVHLFIAYFIREIFKPCACAYRTSVCVLSEQQLEESSFPFAVAPDEAKLPVGIHRERNVLKNVVKASLIAECQGINVYL